MNLEPEVRKTIRFMAVGCAVCAVLVFAGFCIFDKFSLPLVFGTVIGYLLAVGNFYFMSVGMTAALDTGEEIAAKKKLRTSYILRTVVILGILAGAIVLSQKTGMINWIPVAAGVFYVRIVIAAKSVIDYFRLKKNPEPIPEPSAEPEEDNDAEEEDGFEKLVSHFARGPVPTVPEDKLSAEAENDQTTDNND